MDWLQLKILVAWVVIKIVLIFFLKLVIALQLITTKKFGHSNGNWNSVETFFFSIATLQPWCGPMATKNLDCLGGNQNLVNTFFSLIDVLRPGYGSLWLKFGQHFSTINSFLWSLHCNQDVDQLWPKFGWHLSTLKCFFHLIFFGHCTMTRVWIGCNWKSWSLGW